MFASSKASFVVIINVFIIMTSGSFIIIFMKVLKVGIWVIPAQLLFIIIIINHIVHVVFYCIFLQCFGTVHEVTGMLFVPYKCAAIVPDWFYLRNPDHLD